jgi:choline dehydrogenase-like flavoprotein
VILERARLQTEADFKGRELDGAANLFLDRGLAASSDAAIVLFAGSAVGGGTIVNWNTSLRLPPVVREEWGVAGVDDPLDEHYAAVEQRLDIDTDESQRNGPNSVLERGLRALGLPSETIPRNVRGCGDCGHCGVGCRLGAKQSTMRTYLVDACDAGAKILDGCGADRILVRNGVIEGVLAQVDGGPLTVRSPLVALAAGALHSPAILLRSGIAIELAGKNLHLHPTAVVAGIYDEPTPGWVGVPQSVMSDSFADLSPGFGFRLECPPVLPGLLAASTPWVSSAEHRRRMSQAGHTAPFIAIVRDRDSGRVTLDRTGQPEVHYWPTREAREHLVRAMVEATRIHFAAGATEVSTLHTPPVTGHGGDFEAIRTAIERRGVQRNAVALFSAHQMSTCRMGNDRRDSVADPNGEVWGVRGLYVADASAFPTASGVNPMLTVMALARRIAARAR